MRIVLVMLESNLMHTVISKLFVRMPKDNVLIALGKEQMYNLTICYDYFIVFPDTIYYTSHSNI